MVERLLSGDRRALARMISRIEGEEVPTVAEGALFIYLAESVNEELPRGMTELESARVVCLDTAFHGSWR